MRTLASALALLVIAAGCSGKEVAAAPKAPDGELWIAKEQVDKGQVKLAEARVRDIPQSVLAAGRIAFDDLRVTHVFSPITGRITKLLAPLGAQVKKGSPLLAIASPDVGSALADLAKARADLIAARHEHQRQEKLWAAQAGAERDLQTAASAFAKAQAEEQRAAQKAKLLRGGRVDAVTQEYTLTSQLAGEVIARMVNPGAEVQGQYSGGTGAELFTIGDIQHVWAYAEIPESELPRVHQGDVATVRVVAWPETPFRGRVEWIAATLDPALRTARVRISLANPDKLLKPEMFAAVSIEEPPKRMLAVPRKALVQINEQSFVYVAAGSRADGRSVFKRRRVRVADQHVHELKSKPRSSEVMPLEPASDAQYLAIEEGLAAGESVMVEGDSSLERGGEEALVTSEQLRAAGIELTTIVPREVEDALSIGGRLSFDDLRVAHVFSPVTGRVTKVLASPGERVKKGQPLARISSPDLGSAFADLLKAKADLAYAAHEQQRQRELFGAQAGARRDLEAAEDAYGKAKAESDRAETKTRLLRHGVDGLTQEYLLRSPIDGLVVARNASPGLEVQGQYANANTVVELFTVGEIDQLWLLGDVYEMDLPHLRIGQELKLKLAGNSKHEYRGQIDWISAVIDPVMRTAKVRAVIDNPNGDLRPEMYQEASVRLSNDRLLAVPREALLRLGEETVVFVSEGKDKEGNQVFKRRRVLGDESKPGGLVPILDGLKAGETVVTSGAIFLVGLL